MRSIIAQAGGPENQREHNRIVQFPKQDTDGNTIKIEGRTDLVEKLVAIIEEKVTDLKSQVSETVDVPADRHPALIGRGGEVKRQLEATHKVTIHVPLREESSTGVKITGQPDNVAKAKERILTIAKEKQAETLQIPRSQHHAVSGNGQLFQKLRRDWGVIVDHAGQATPPKQQPSRANGGSLPLITDDADAAADAHSWSVAQQSTEEGDIPWVLKGSAENIEKAKKTIQAALEQAPKNGATGYLVLSDPGNHRYIIGTGGSTIKTIRQKSGCKIDVPRQQESGDTITITGSKEGVEKAKDLILAAVRDGLSKGRD